MSTSTFVPSRLILSLALCGISFGAPLPAEALNEVPQEAEVVAVTVPISAEAFDLAGTDSLAVATVDLSNAADYMPESPEPFRTDIAGMDIGGMDANEMRRWLEGGFITGKVFNFPVIPVGAVLLLAMCGAAGMLWSVGEVQPGMPLPPYPRPGPGRF